MGEHLIDIKNTEMSLNIQPNETNPYSDTANVNFKKKKKKDRVHMQNNTNLKIYSDKILGKGSYSKVFPGMYKNNIVAVKIISTQNLDKKITKQLKRELDVISVLHANQHQNIATYYKIFQDSSKMIIVMELCSGGELSKYINIGIDLHTVRNYFSQILKGYAHLLGLCIVHRDIKSANLLLSDDKKIIKFIDFGLSKIFSVDLSSTVCGSPLYMAPELLYHQEYNSKADIWSIGVLLYEMVYGITPFHDCKFISTLKQNMHMDMIEYPEYSHNQIYKVPHNLINYMRKLLELDPVKRINWKELAEADWLLCIENNPTPLISPDHSFAGTSTFNESHYILPQNSDTHQRECHNNSDNTLNHTAVRSNQDNTKNGLMQNTCYVDQKYDKYSGPSLLSKELIRTIGLAKPTMGLNSRFDNPDSFNTVGIDHKSVTIPQRMQNNENMITPNIINSYINVLPIKRDTTLYDTILFGPNVGKSDPITIVQNEKNRKSGKKILYPNESHNNASPQTPELRSESFGNVVFTNLGVDDLSVIENKHLDSFRPYVRKHREKTSDSGLIDVNDISDTLIANIPDRSTALEYISKGSVVVSSYLYSRSAPIASNLFTKIGRAARKTAKAVRIISPI